MTDNNIPEPGSAQEWKTKFPQILEQARQAYSHKEGITDLECVALMASRLLLYTKERTELLNLNAGQAQKIAALRGEIGLLRRKFDRTQANETSD